MSGGHALITGGSGAIGAACARALAADGLSVAIGYGRGAAAAQQVAHEIRAGGGDARAVHLDVTDADSVLDAVADAGAVTHLVVAAGGPADGLALRMTTEAFRDTLDLNLTGAFRVVQAALRPMVKARRGRIVLVGSVAGSVGSAGQCNYAAAKAGLVGLARSVAREVATRGVTCNVVEPGPITTPMTDGLGDGRRAELAAAVPMARFGTPTEVAAAVRFLCSEDAAYVTGAVVPVDGGLAMGR